MLTFLKRKYFLFLIFIGLNSCIADDYVEFRPHYSSKMKGKYYGEAALDTLMLKNIVQVLEYYGEDFKIESGNKVFIKKELNDSWELLYNYTSKAKDANWIQSHKPDQN